MDEKAHFRFEALDKLACFWWENFQGRRRYEWQFTIGLWTALILFTGFVITKGLEAKAPVKGAPVATSPDFTPKLVKATTGVVGAVTVFYVIWLWQLSSANALDRKQMFAFAEEMKEAVGVKFDEEFQKKLDKQKDRHWIGKNWSPILQTLITITLAGFAIGAVRIVA